MGAPLYTLFKSNKAVCLAIDLADSASQSASLVRTRARRVHKKEAASAPNYSVWHGSSHPHPPERGGVKSAVTRFCLADTAALGEEKREVEERRERRGRRSLVYYFAFFICVFSIFFLVIKVIKLYLL